MLEPTTSQFEAHHKIETEDDATEPEDLPFSGSIHAVLLADGIHNQVTDDDIAKLPRRFESSPATDRYAWFGTLCFAGVGMFIEAYMIITTGQVKTIWYAQYPECWKPSKKQACANLIACCGLFPNTPQVNGTCTPYLPDQCNADGTFPSTDLCTDRLIHAVSYVEFAGIMLGMITFGKVADIFGKVQAGVITSLFMMVGIAFMSFYDNNDTSTIFLAFSISYFVFGWGIGGEYPITAMSAAENRLDEKLDAHADDETRARRRILVEKAQAARRGETISVAFAMQGAGAVFGSAYILFLLYFSGQSRSDCTENIGNNSTGTNPDALNGIWRAFYLLGGTFVVMLFLYRFLVEKDAKLRTELVERKQNRGKQIRSSTFKILQFYWPKLIGTGGTWFILDVAFYGLKLFSGPIFAAINPHGSLIIQNGYLLIYNLCGLVGYFCAASIMDNPKYGRWKFQLASFTVLTFLFLLTAAIFEKTTSHVLIFLFFISNFFSNFGVNVTVYVMAAETYPTEVRGTCHGLSAFLGKLGAFIATIVFSHITVQAIFYVCGITSAIGLVITYIFGCDMTRLSFAEHDAQFEFFLDGQPEKYKGRLNAREHLSYYEIWTGRHGEYDPDWAHKLIGKNVSTGKRKDEFEF